MTAPDPLSSFSFSDRHDSRAAADGNHAQWALDWGRDGQNWPHRQASRFAEAGGIRWHVQVMGEGPVMLLLHGTGAACHSWRGMMPLLAEHFTVVAPDLPGHGFTASPRSDALSLPGMARLLTELLRVLDCRPLLVVGHSAGAAIAVQLSLDGSIAPRQILSINGALLPLAGLAGWLYTPMARFLAQGGLWARVLAHSAGDRGVVERLLERTGSVISAQGIDLYALLLRNAGHTAAALGMMAHWDLRPLLSNLPRLRTELVLVVGDKDAMVPPEQALRIRALVPAASVVNVPGCGHLLHEENPVQTARLIVSLAAGTGVDCPA